MDTSRAPSTGERRAHAFVPAEAMTSRLYRPPVLPSMLLAQHTAIAATWQAAAHHRPTATDPHRPRQLADAFMVTTCRHLAAVYDGVLPAARAAASGDRSLAADYLHGCRELERTLHQLKAAMYGDTYAARANKGQLWRRLRLLLYTHEAHETALLQRLTRDMTPEAHAILLDRLQRSQRHAPTRPHPYSPHTGVTGRLSNRIWSVLDAVWDRAECRFIPPQ